MNAAIRAVVRTAIFHGLQVAGIERGFAGLLMGEIQDLDLKSVSGIVNRGGTILRTVRCPEFKKKLARREAINILRRNAIDGMVIIGGDGSLAAGRDLVADGFAPIVAIPATIDNDLPGTDQSIGFDTAINTAVEAIDKIRDTATSHERIFVIEVMGRDHGIIALEVGLAAGAEIILVPEMPVDIDKVGQQLKIGHQRGKVSSIVVVAEGVGRAHDIAARIEKKTRLEVRYTVLGHVQRGGTPSALSRKIASVLGAAAVDGLLDRQYGKMVGVVADRILFTPFNDVLRQRRKINLANYKLAEILAK